VPQPKSLLIGVALLALVSGCALSPSNDGAPPSAPPADSPTATAQPSPSPSPTLPQLLHPLTGLPYVEPSGLAASTGMPPVLAVKIDNTRNAQPQVGMEAADLVYVEEIEYGMTRLAAIFSSTIPARIGPVRSARITDIELLSQYGSPAFAFSGAQSKLWPALAEAPFIDVSANKDPQDYSRDSSRPAPYNYFFDAETALAQLDGVSPAKDMGFTFAQEIPSGGSPAVSAELTWPSSSLKFRYDPIRNHYAIQLNGERARFEEVDQQGDGRVWADTAVIQFVEQTQSVYFDKGGGNTPQVQTVGSGEAIILRNGQLFSALWSRPDSQSGTTFTDTLGNPVPFHPGHTWIALYNKDRDVVIKSTNATPTQLTNTRQNQVLNKTRSPLASK
jgi:hypothetical protein